MNKILLHFSVNMNNNNKNSSYLLLSTNDWQSLEQKRTVHNQKNVNNGRLDFIKTYRNRQAF